MPTDSDVLVKDIVNAFELSFDTQKMVRMRKKDTYVPRYKIFCDLDGVLADFEKGVFTLTDKYPKDLKLSVMWTKVLNDNNFFSKLEWMEKGEELWNFIVNLTKELSLDKPTILTGMPRECKNKVTKDKKEWCSQKLGNYETIVCKTVDKHKYSDKGHILIDDRYDTGKTLDYFQLQDSIQDQLQ